MAVILVHPVELQTCNTGDLWGHMIANSSDASNFEFKQDADAGSDRRRRLARLAGHHSKALDHRSTYLGIGDAPPRRPQVDLYEIYRTEELRVVAFDTP